MQEGRPPRQPLFWAAITFSLGIWWGVRAWRPPSWWAIALVGFIYAASFFLSKREWFSKALSLGAWFLLGAFLIQVRSQPQHPEATAPPNLELADGGLLVITAHVLK
jgi:hypothetical protein